MNELIDLFECNALVSMNGLIALISLIASNAMVARVSMDALIALIALKALNARNAVLTVIAKKHHFKAQFAVVHSYAAVCRERLLPKPIFVLIIATAIHNTAHLRCK